MRKLRHFAVVVCVLFPGVLVGQVTVGLPSQSFNYVAAAQIQNEWCWAASIQMILGWYGIPATQPEIVVHAYGAPINAPGSNDAIARALSGSGRDRFGNFHIISSVTAAGAPMPQVLINELTQQHPILLAFQNGPNTGHAVVITAASYFLTPNGPHITSLVIRDPFPTPINLQNAGRVVIDGPALAPFISTVRQHWLVQVR
jgi:papain like cysteine protease AvrRpt2